MNKKFNLDNFDLLTDKKASEEEKICSKCKTKNISSAKFCIECGNNTFRKLSSGDRFCVACNIKLDNSDSTCPICGKKEFVDSIEKLISNRVDLQDKKVLVEHSKLEEEVFQLSNSLNFSKMRNEELELYVDRYNKKIEKLKNEINNKISSKKSLTEKLKSDIKDANSSFEEKNKNYVEISNNLSKIKNEFIEFTEFYEINKSEYEDVLARRNQLRLEYEETLKKLDETRSKSKKVCNIFTNDFLDIELALYNDLAMYYLNFDKKKALRYAIMSIECKDRLENIIYIVNDFTTYFYDENEKRYWNEYAFEIYHKNSKNLSNYEKLAYAMILADKNSKHYNKEMSLDLVENCGLTSIYDNGFIAIAYCLLDMKDKAINLLEDTCRRIEGRSSVSVHNKSKEVIKKLLNDIKNIKL